MENSIVFVLSQATLQFYHNCQQIMKVYFCKIYLSYLTQFKSNKIYNSCYYTSLPHNYTQQQHKYHQLRQSTKSHVGNNMYVKLPSKQIHFFCIWGPPHRSQHIKYFDTFMLSCWLYESTTLHIREHSQQEYNLSIY